MIPTGVYRCRHALWLALGAAVVGLTGCGYEVYERRLEESRKYFTYLEKLDAHLGPVYRDGPIEEFRPPLGFRQVPPPAPVRNESGELEEPVFDPRQPHYLNREFPGLIATWEAQFDVATNEGRTRRPGYLYALSNATLLTTQPDIAPEFTQEVLTILADAFSLPIPELGSAAVEEYPRAKTYTSPKRYEVYRFPSDQIVIEGFLYTVEVYVHRQGEVQFLLVLILPAGIESNARLADRIPLMLERLKVSSKRIAPKKTGGKAASPGAPPPRPTTGF